MCGDVAGLCAKVDHTHDAWWSPAGLTRGTIKNIIKTSWEPPKANLDTLYKAGINPFITQTGSGVILWGDKTMQSAPTAFDRINVRRLFIVLEKAIENAAKSMLFEFNDEFTRSQFVNMVEPFLREVQGRRGITDFKVVCDGSNNTGTVIDANNFVGDIYVKPTRSINFIQLNFIAARSDISFTEIGG
jgi:phage tail sheath protein FI